MINLAFLVTARRDLGPSAPYLFDLRPDGLYASPSITPPGQTRRVPDAVEREGEPFLVVAADKSATTAREEKGLSIWAIDNIQNQDGGKSLALTPTQAAKFESEIFLRVDAGLSLTGTDVDAVLNTIPGVSGSSVFSGPKSKSTGTLVDLLKILATYPYRVSMGSLVVSTNGEFPVNAMGNHVPVGSFSKPPMEVKSRQGLPPDPVRPPPTRPDPPAERAPLILSAELLESIRSGWLSKLVDPNYQFHRGGIRYGQGGEASTLGGQPIESNYRARAVVVYDQTGNVIR